MPSEIIPSDYPAWLETLKRQITASRSCAALAVNAELIHLYHRVGREILDRQTHHGWGSKVITRIADDLKAAFPDMKGFSPRNVKYMRYFAEHCPDGQFGQQPAAQLPWFHFVTLLTKAHPPEREWYATQCFAAVKTALWPNTPSTASTSASVSRSSISYAISRFPWPRTCPVSSKSKPSWPMKLCQTTANRKPTMNKPIPERMPRHTAKPYAQSAESAKLEHAIQVNLRGLGYGW